MCTQREPFESPFLVHTRRCNHFSGFVFLFFLLFCRNPFLGLGWKHYRLWRLMAVISLIMFSGGGLPGGCLAAQACLSTSQTLSTRKCWNPFFVNWFWYCFHVCSFRLRKWVALPLWCFSSFLFLSYSLEDGNFTHPICMAYCINILENIFNCNCVGYVLSPMAENKKSKWDFIWRRWMTSNNPHEHSCMPVIVMPLPPMEKHNNRMKTLERAGAEYYSRKKEWMECGSQTRNANWWQRSNGATHWRRGVKRTGRRQRQMQS